MEEVSDDVAQARDGRSPPTVLRTVVICLAVLAVVAPAGGMAGGLVILASAEATANLGPLLVQVLAYFLAGWAGGAVLWAAAWTLRQQYEVAALQRRILEMLDSGWVASVQVGPPAVPADRAPASAQGPEADGPAAAGEAVLARLAEPSDSQILRRLLAELEEIRADLLLSPEQREAKREEIHQARVARWVGRIGDAIQNGEVAEAERLLVQLEEAEPNDARTSDLRARLGERLADDAGRALDAGDVGAAEKLLQRLAEEFGPADRVAALREKVAGHRVHEIDTLIDQGDLAGASGKLERLAQRYGDDPRCAQLGRRLSAARAAVQDGEVLRCRRQVEELMAVAAFDKAEALAVELAARHPDSPEAANLPALVRREAEAFRTERRARLFAEIQRYVENRQWRHALEAARRLLENHPDFPEAKDVSAMMPTLQENAKIEEVRGLRDRIRDMVRRRRFAEAAEIAREVIRCFPQTQAAIELRQQLPRLERRAASGQGHKL